MRIRSIKPEFWRSRDVTDLSVEDRLLFIGLWSYVDDNGVGRDEEESIIADLFARDMFCNPRETVARVARGLRALCDKGLIVRYTLDDRPYLYVTGWEDHQRIDRPAKARFPRPDAVRAVLATPSRDSRDTLATGTGEQGNRGTEEQGSSGAGAPRRAARLPDDWTPTEDHAERARSAGLDLAREATKFRAHAEEKGRTAKNWNAAFTRWLINAAEYAARDARRGGAPTTDRQMQILRQEMERAREWDSRHERLEIEK